MPLAHSFRNSVVSLPSPSPNKLNNCKFPVVDVAQFIVQLGTVQERENFMYELLSTMPRSQLSSLQRRIAPLLQFDIISSLPTETALQIFSYLPPHTLLICALVSKRWNVLADDQSLWKALCYAQGWEWRYPALNSDGPQGGNAAAFPMKLKAAGVGDQIEDKDEGMGDSDDGSPPTPVGMDADSLMMDELDSGFVSGSVSLPLSSPSNSGFMSPLSGSRVKPRNALNIPLPRSRTRLFHKPRHSIPTTAPPSLFTRCSSKPDYKFLYRTHTQLRNRFLTSSYQLSIIQTRGSPPNGHASMIYCVQLYTYATTNQQVIFTGSRDKTIREWNLRTCSVERVFEGIHTESVLSLCVRNGWMASAGSDRRVVLWRLDKDYSRKGRSAKGRHRAVKILRDHADSVLCVRFDDERLVSCSKDRTVRVYTFPGLELLYVFKRHRAAVNAISLSKDFVVSGSGDRSMNIWDVKTGRRVRTFEDHHIRGIASIDFKPPYIVSGSSDTHIRLIDMNTSQGWSTSPDYDSVPLGLALPGLELGLMPLGPAHAPFLPPGWHPPQHMQIFYGGSSDTCGNISNATASTSTMAPIADLNGTSSLLSAPALASVSPAIPAASSTLRTPSMSVSYTHSYSHSHFLPHPRFPYRHYAHAYFAHPYAFPRRNSTSNSTQSLHNASTTNNTSSQTNNNHADIHNTILFSLPHTDLVRSVALGPDFIVTGSYDLSVKIWDRMSGILVADLTGGHIGKIFCVAADRTKVVSCGEDSRICIWDFSRGMEGIGWLKNE